LLKGPRRYGRERLGAGDWGAGPIGPAGPIIPPGFISPGFISPGFISLQQAIAPGAGCSCQWPSEIRLRKNPEKKIAETMNNPPATMPTHAKAWLSRLRWPAGETRAFSFGALESSRGETLVELDTAWTSCS
jgi:hypothetical protein